MLLNNIFAVSNSCSNCTVYVAESMHVMAPEKISDEMLPPTPLLLSPCDCPDPTCSMEDFALRDVIRNGLVRSIIAK